MDFDLMNNPPSAAPSQEPTAPPSVSLSVEPTAFPTALQTSAMPSTTPTQSAPSVRPTPRPGDPTWSPTPIPSVAKLTPVPSAQPSYMTSPILSFNSSLTMSGVTSSYLDQPAQQSVISAAAISMGITTNTISYLGSIATAENRRLFTTDFLRGFTLFTTSYKMVSLLKVSVPLSATTYTNSTLLYKSLTQSLNTAVVSGAFTTSLQEAAVLNNATSVVAAQVTNVTNSAPSVNNDLQYPPDNSNKSDSLTEGEIVGISIGLFVFFALVAAGCYYFVYIRPGAQESEVIAFASNSSVEITL
eukprot:CAMPEP_0170378148 /NCGR_PEP_ID=MMETSP0117_2-20130122/12658_1 /TAXON_ID=400756 /ORGANISM="Durinskia baltica, Strain CSIRO CS-38" /LENGTH=300 /DNA_ID=CAMNT_0010633507 /DNA_START=253 /DNA_END=1155 /DNA_ORIENTATION=-